MYAKMRLRHAALVAVTALFLVVPLQTSVRAATVTYQHDAKGRVLKATFSDGTVVNYSYDANGSRTAAVVTPVPPDTTAPSVPGTPTISNVTGTSATASWTAATDNVAVAGYDYRLNAGAWQSLGNILTTSLVNLTPAANYTFNVRARDGAGNLGPASSRTFSTPDTAAPTVPTNVSGTAPTSTTVILTWSASTDNVAVTGYKVFRGGAQIGTSATTSYTDNTVTGSTAYSYRVSAFDAIPNNSLQSAAANVTTPDTIAPAIPTGLVATAAGSTQINLSWSASSDSGGSGLAGYRIYRGGSQVNTTAATSYSDAGLSPATAYSYTVAAYDNAVPTNVSAQSAAAQATTLTVLAASVSSTGWQWIRRANNAPKVDPDIVASASGGTGSGYTYLWERVSGDTQTNLSTAPTNPVARWNHPIPNMNTDYNSVWRCRVSDSSGTIVYTANVHVRFRWTF
jgi:YD repeat-containing protein